MTETSFKSITRSEVLHRAASAWPYEGVPYSQDKLHSPDGYRQDCSGYVSMCWDLPTSGAGDWGGYSTVTLVTAGVMFEIDPNNLKPGDAIGKCGPNTAGDDGHIQLFVAWLNNDPNDSHYYCYEQTGGSSGPHKRLYDWPHGYRAYRFKAISDDPVVPPTPKPSGAPRYPLGPGQYFGLITGPANYHGGYYLSERPLVKAIQQKLIAKGCVPGITNVNSSWADGKYEQPTVDAVERFQRAHGLQPDGVVGPKTWLVLMS